MRNRVPFSVALAAALLVIVVGAVFAAEYQTNGDFEVDVSGWSPYRGGSIVHDTTTTHRGSAGSGEVTNAGITRNAGVYQCVDIPTSGPSNIYGARAWINVPAASPNFAAAYIRKIL